MAELKYKVGDRVLLRRDWWYLNSIYRAVPQYATVRALHTMCDYTVETDNDTGGHVGDGQCKAGHGWWVHELDITLVARTPFEQKVHDYIQRELPNG